MQFYAEEYTLGSDGSRDYKLVRDATLDGVSLRLESDATPVWHAPAGPIGTRVLTGDDNIGAWQYTPYATVSQTPGGHKAEASITTANGSVLHIADSYIFKNHKLDVTPDIRVVAASPADKGFVTNFALRTVEQTDPTSLKWFAPPLLVRQR